MNCKYQKKRIDSGEIECIQPNRGIDRIWSLDSPCSNISMCKYFDPIDESRKYCCRAYQKNLESGVISDMYGHTIFMNIRKKKCLQILFCPFCGKELKEIYRDYDGN